jgi:pimeloyl-ACP methyl ester carboxylesterase
MATPKNEFDGDVPTRQRFKPAMQVLRALLFVYIAVVALVYFMQRSILYFPGHGAGSGVLVPWSDGHGTIGFCREAPNPRTIWLMMHGNAGQAANRAYVLSRMSDHDSLYVLEYPGYGQRQGSPTRDSMNQAASEAYQLLRGQNPGTPVCVLGESIGSGPACELARKKVPPDKIVLVVPFDTLANVASGHYPFLPVRLILRDAWDNVESLSHYSGPVEIFGASGDSIIPIKHAMNLAKKTPSARFTAIPGGHNDWSESEQVSIKK